MDTTPIPMVAESAPSSAAARDISRATLCLSLAIAAWVVAISFGWWKLATYQFGPDSSQGALIVAHWPTDTNLSLASGRATILFFVHPKCPCTRASLAELERLWMLNPTDTPRPPQLIVVATVPPGATDDWTTTATIERARAMAGAQIVIDENGSEARRFGVATSGTVMWFDAKGRRLYSGGITASRGHEGDNAGRDALTGLMRGGRDPAFGPPALGCRLCLPAADAAAVNRIGEQRSTEFASDG